MGSLRSPDRLAAEGAENPSNPRGNVIRSAGQPAVQLDDAHAGRIQIASYCLAAVRASHVTFVHVAEPP
jgi:hypothetical protein